MGKHSQASTRRAETFTSGFVASQYSVQPSINNANYNDDQPLARPFDDFSRPIPPPPSHRSGEYEDGRSDDGTDFDHQSKSRSPVHYADPLGEPAAMQSPQVINYDWQSIIDQLTLTVSDQKRTITLSKWAQAVSDAENTVLRSAFAASQMRNGIVVQELDEEAREQ